MMLKNFAQFETSIPNVEDMDVNVPYFLTLSDGVYRYMRNNMVLDRKLMGALDTKIYNLEEGEEGLKLIIPKIDFKFYLYTLNFFKEVFEQYKSEASTVCYYIKDHTKYDEFISSLDDDIKETFVKEGDFFIHAPRQFNTPQLTQFGDDENFQYLSDNQDLIKVIEIHSHHVMSTFWSGIDDKNQTENIFYGVFGEINSKDDFLMKFVSNGISIELPTQFLFDVPKIKFTETKKIVGKGLDYIKNKPFKNKHLRYEYLDGVIDNDLGFPESWLRMLVVPEEKEDIADNFTVLDEISDKITNLEKLSFR